MCMQCLIGMYADDMAVELENAKIATQVLVELENLARDNLLLNKKKTKALVTSTPIKNTLIE